MLKRSGSTARLWFGLGFILLGIVWTLDNLYYVDADEVFRFWPLLLVVFGLSKLVRRHGGSRPVAGLLWVAAGVILLVHTTDVVPWGIWDLWPLFLVLLGGTIVWRSFRGPQIERSGHHGENRAAAADNPPHDVEDVSGVAVWAGIERKTSSQAFRGGDFTAVMGAGEIFLTGARTVPGGAVMDLFVVMGGVEITVPPDWRVVNDVWAFMGAVEDARKSTPPTSESVLYLKGICIMGGVEIKNPKN
jgi:predicted membrane protein